MSGTIPFPNGGGKGVPPQRKMDVLLRGIYAVLPCSSLEEIQAKLKARGLDVSMTTIEQGLFHLRKYANIYGWSVPHVKRGNNSEGRQYFAVLRDKEKGFVLPKEYETYSRKGFNGSISHIANMGRSESVALRMMLQSIKSRAAREVAEELIIDLEYISKKAKALLRRSLNG